MGILLNSTALTPAGFWIILPEMKLSLIMCLALSAYAADPDAVSRQGHEAHVRNEVAEAAAKYGEAAAAFLAAGDRLNWARSTYNQAQQLFSLGRFPKALSLMNEAVAEFARAQPKGSLEYAQALMDRARLLRNMEQPKEAESQLRQAVAMIEHVSPGDVVLPAALSALGSAINDQDRFAEASKIHDQAVAWARQPRVPTEVLANTLEAAGAGAIYAGRYELAVERLSESLKLSASLSGEAHSITARHRYKLGWAKMRAGDLSGADAELTRAHADAAQGMGPQAPITAASLSLLGEVRRRQKRFEEALEIQQKAAKTAGQIAHRGFIGGVEIELGVIMRETGRLPEAATHFALAEKHVKGAARGELRREEGLLHLASGRADAAAASLKEALALYAPLGKAHPRVIEAQRDYETAVSKGGRVEKSASRSP